MTGTRGPRSKLFIQDLLDGFPGHQKGKMYVDEGPKAAGSLFVPDHLPDDAKGMITIIQESMPPGVYARLDSFLVSAYAIAWWVHKTAVEHMSSPDFEWTEVNNETGISKANPWIGVQQKHAMLMASLGDRLGLDPKARQSLKNAAKGGKKSKFSGLIGGRRQRTPEEIAADRKAAIGEAPDESTSH